MADDAAIAPELVDYIEDYLEETGLDEAVERDELDPDSNLIVFCREVFVQLFANVIGETISTIGPTSAERANVLLRLHRHRWPASLRRLVGRFQHFCKMYPDLVGKQYGDGSDEISEFHLDFVPDLLRELEAWAEAQEQDALLAAIKRVRGPYDQAVKGFYDDVIQRYADSDD